MNKLDEIELYPNVSDGNLTFFGSVQDNDMYFHDLPLF